MRKPVAPRRGDIISIDFDPQTGVEQARRRPAIVLTEHEYNDRVGLCVVCPITTKVKARPFEIPLPDDCKVRGVVLVDHIKSLDWYERKCKFMTAAPAALVDSVLDVLADILAM